MCGCEQYLLNVTILYFKLIYIHSFFHSTIGHGVPVGRGALNRIIKTLFLIKRIVQPIEMHRQAREQLEGQSHW